MDVDDTREKDTQRKSTGKQAIIKCIANKILIYMLNR